MSVNAIADVNAEELGDVIEPRLRVLQGEPRQPQWYVDPGWADHRALLRFIEDGEAHELSGVVVSAGEDIEERQAALRAQARERGLEVVLDPHVLEEAYEGGAHRGFVTRQPWSTGRRARPRDLRGHRGAAVARQIASKAVALDCTAVIAPSHLLVRGLHDPWWPIDMVLAMRLKREFERLGRSDMLLYYRLALPAATLRNDPGIALRVVRQMRRLRPDGLWLLFHPAGLAHSGPESIRGHLRTCQQLHRLGVPMMFERAGIVGLAVTAFGGVGGVVTGVGALESFDESALKQVPEDTGESFGPPQRVYIPELFAYLNRRDAEPFFDNRLMRARYGCQRRCCRTQGPEDTIRQPKLHVLYAKAEELRRLAQTPEHRRPDALRSDVQQSVTALVQATTIAKPLETTMRRLAGLDRSLDAASREHLAMRYDLPRAGSHPGPGPRPQAVG